MGGFYGSIQVRTTDRAAVKTAIERVAGEKKICCLIGPELNGWVGIYPENSGQDDSVAAEIARQIDADVLHLIVHDDDVLAYWLWRKHELVDSYWSKPGYFGDANRAEEESRRGDAEQFRAIVGDKTKDLSKLLAREIEFTFESERLKKLAKFLGISNAVTEYDSLVSDERDGIKGWRKFEKIPADPVVPDVVAAKPKSKPAKSIREMLRKSGLLLYSHDWKEFGQLLHGFPIGAGFVLSWVNPWLKTSELKLVAPPSWIPEVLPSAPDMVAAQTQGDFAVVGAGDVLRIMNKFSSPWQLICEVKQIDQVPFTAISPGGEFIVHLNQVKIVVRSLPSGDTICEIRRTRSSKIAFHPTQRALAVTGDMLGLIHLDDEPRLREIYPGAVPGCVGFSCDGRFLWCGTDSGLQIYDGVSLAGQLSRKPRWLLRFADPLPTSWAKQVTAVTEEPGGAGVVFANFAGKLARFSFETADLYKLVDLPGGGEVETLLFSADGKALATGSDKSTQKGPRSMPKHERAWEVWDYCKLRSLATLIGRAEKRMPASQTEGSPEDMSLWRRVSARGGRPRR
jgi:hypothetical protein